ncbi:MAG: hypothetical protein MI867_04740 [Pseudomonadales bacterium]|nr:hypothetical protein [Pseudomonadales bacterium]
MEAFFSNIFSFPTIIFTGLLLFMCFYWLLAIAGLLDLDVLDLDLDVDTDVDLDVSGFAGLMVTLGLTGVPFTVVLTLLIGISWLLCYFMVHFFFFWGDNNLFNLLVGSGVVLGSFAVSIPITAKIIKPMRPFFRSMHNLEVKKVIVGKTCTIRTTRVDKSFGEANLIVDGADLIIKVRAEAEHKLSKGDTAFVVEHNKDENTYWVEPTK